MPYLLVLLPAELGVCADIRPRSNCPGVGGGTKPSKMLLSRGGILRCASSDRLALYCEIVRARRPGGGVEVSCREAEAQEKVGLRRVLI